MSVHYATDNVNPTTKLYMSTAPVPPGNRWTGMCWARWTLAGQSYFDLFGSRDQSSQGGDGNVVGATLWDSSGAGTNCFYDLGDTTQDAPDTRKLVVGEWHHFAMTVDAIPGGLTRCCGYVDGALRIQTNVLVPTTATVATGLRFYVFNSREGDTDPGAVFWGDISSVKIWTNYALNPQEVAEEVWYYLPQRLNNIYAVSPLFTLDHITQNYVGQDWTLQTSSSRLSTADDPPGVLWDNSMARRNPINFFVPPTPTFTAAWAYRKPRVIGGGII